MCQPYVAHENNFTPEMSEMVVQIHPVVSRLCAPIEGTDAAHIADCLGLDASSVLTSPSPISCNNLWWISTSDWQVYVHVLGCAIQTVISVPWRIHHVQLSHLSHSWECFLLVCASSINARALRTPAKGMKHFSPLLLFLMMMTSTFYPSGIWPAAQSGQ